MEQGMTTNMKIVLGVNIAIACLGIFMTYKANKTDEQIQKNVETYMRNRVEDKLSDLVDNAINELNIDPIVTMQLTKVVTDVAKTAITDEIKNSVNRKVYEIANDNQIIIDIKNSLKDSDSFAARVAGQLARDSSFINALKTAESKLFSFRQL
jgi:hypothetical protein